MDKDFTDLGIVFQHIIGDLKGSYPLWEDFIKQSSKFHSTLRYTLAGVSSFLESFQKLADFAMESKGGPRDIGSSLIKLCLRHRAIENHLKSYTNALMECLVVPLQEKMDEWKKNVLQLDKDHGKECKKMQVDVKKASGETMKLQKKVNKGKSEAKTKLDVCMKDYNTKLSTLELAERNAIVSAITEHRSRFSYLFGCIKPVVIQEITMAGEMENLKELMNVLDGQVSNPSGMIDQTFTDILHGFHATLERKRRNTKEEADFMGTMSRSSSTSGESILKNGTEMACLNLALATSVQGHHPHMTKAPSDDVQQSPVYAMTVDDNFFFRQEFASIERPHTVSIGGPTVYPHTSQVPYITANTFVPPPAVQQQQMQQQMQQQLQQQQQQSASSSALSNSSTGNLTSGSKKLENIYTRPALLKREGSVTLPSPVFVAMPTVPNFPDNKQEKLDRVKVDVDISSLDQAMLDLEKNTKLLEISHTCPAMSLQSLQSLQSMQCSSGYGTMTNISSNSAETIQSIAELDALLETSLSDLEKYNTLPVKRLNHSKNESDNKRPVSSSDEVTSSNNGWQQQVKSNKCSFPSPGNYDDTDFPLPPPPDDFLLSSFPDHFPPPPSLHNTSQQQQQQQQQQHSYHHPQALMSQHQKDLNAVLRQRFSQIQQNLPTLQEQAPHIPPPVRPKPGPTNSINATSLTQRRSLDEGSSRHYGMSSVEVTTTTGLSTDLSTLLRNVSLRKTVVNDRSAPLLKKT